MQNFEGVGFGCCLGLRRSFIRSREIEWTEVMCTYDFSLCLRDINNSHSRQPPIGLLSMSICCDLVTKVLIKY